MAKVDRHGIGPADTRFGGNLEMANRRQQYDPRTFDWNPRAGDILSNRTDQNVKHSGSETDSWKRDFWTTRNPDTNRLASQSVIEHGPNLISNRFVYPSGYGKDYATGEEFQLKGPQTWMYDPADRSGIMQMADSSVFNTMKEGYDFINDYYDIDDNRINYEWNKPLWGGNLNIGGEYDLDDDDYKVGINWGTTWG
tara:strand:- start:635 stop:1222 length:588 start_codon:yes stop_codon:yes gene_type:complete